MHAICCFCLFCTRISIFARERSYFVSIFRTKACVSSVDQLYVLLALTTIRWIDICIDFIHMWLGMAMTTKTIRHVTDCSIHFNFYAFFIVAVIHKIESKHKILFLAMHTAWGTLYTNRSYPGIHSYLVSSNIEPAVWQHQFSWMLEAYCCRLSLNESLSLILNSSNCKSKTVWKILVSLNISILIHIHKSNICTGWLKFWYAILMFEYHCILYHLNLEGIRVHLIAYS